MAEEIKKSPEVEQSLNDDKPKKDDKSKSKKSAKTKSVKSKEKSKITKLEAENAELKKLNNQLKDQTLRKMAEFENYKRRSEKEFLAYLENANEGLITQILPVLDDFERSLDHNKDAKNSESFLEGIELVYKKLLSILEKQGMKPMESVGTEFDPDRHQALMQVDSEEYDSGYVVEEHLKGYLLNDKVIRHTQVLVSK